MGSPEVRRSGNGSRVALIVIGVLVLLAAVWFFVLKGENQAQESALPSDRTVEAAPEPDASTPPVAPTKNGPVETFEVFAPKDPFTPLVSVAAASGATADTTGSGSTDGASTAGGTAAGNDIGGHSVKLVDAGTQNGRNARVNVDGTVYTVDEGERFAENFELVAAQGSCVTMLFGDDQFTLCEGEEILK
ncbi:MAG: hypothetical protein M3391_05205 [Actinomycetota bacterium]|nr:hypothetical protein [Actinomycetota bacterium]